MKMKMCPPRDGARPAGLRRDQRGAAMVLTALSLFVLLGLTALAVDGGYLYATRTGLQGAADAAALAAVEELPDADAVRTTAQHYAALNLPEARYGHVLVDGDVAAGQWDPATRSFTPGASPANATRVTTRRAQANGNPVRMFFAQVLGFAEVDVVAEAVAARGDAVCLLVLDPSSPDALIADSNARLSAPECAIRVNSTSSSGLRTDSNATIDAASACVTGGYAELGNSSITPTPETGCPEQADPLADLAPPATSGCTYNERELDGETATLSPGVYCGGLEINESDVTFNPGIYVIKDGRFYIDHKSTATGSGVSFYLEGDDAVLEFDADSVVDLSAPTTGPMAGVLFFHDRTASGDPVHLIDASSDNKRLQGVLYFPAATLLVDDNGSLGSASSCTLVVAQRVELDSNVTVNLGADPAGCPAPLPAALGGRPRLVR